MPGTDNRYDMLSDNARQEEIRLKKIKQGIIADTENEEYLKEKEAFLATPMSFKEKLSNFWYHYKWASIVVSVTLIAVTIFVIQMLGRTQYDTTVVLATYGKYVENKSSNGEDASYYLSYLQDEIDGLSKELKAYIPDINGNGSVDVGVFQAKYLKEGIEGDTTGYQSALQAAVMARIADGSDCIYIIEKDILDTLSQKGVFADLNKPFGMRSEKEVYGIPITETDILKNKEFESNRETLCIAVRVYKEGTDKELYNAQLNAVKEIYQSSLAK